VPLCLTVIITSDRPWRRHDRFARRLVTGAILLAAIVVLAEWLWWFGSSLFAQTPALPARIQSIHRAGEFTYSRFTGPPTHHNTSVDASSDVTSKNWNMTRDLDASLFSRSQAASTNDEFILRSRAAFYLDPPLSVNGAEFAYFASSLVMQATLDDGSRVWIYELRRPAHQYKSLYNVQDYFHRGLYRRDIVVLDASRSRLILRASRYENLFTGTLRFATFRFLALAGLVLLIVALPAGRSILQGRRIRARFQSRRCVACGYPLAMHNQGLQPCAECGQLQWPADTSAAQPS